MNIIFYVMTLKTYLNKDYSSKKEIQERILKLERDVKVLNKLHFILDLYDGSSVYKASKKLGISTGTGYKWLNEWNEKGFESLERKSGSGGKSKLTNQQFEYLDEKIQELGLKTSKEIKEFIEKEFKVTYSIRQIDRILNKLNYTYSKPYTKYAESPENAEEDLKKKLKN